MRLARLTNEQLTKIAESETASDAGILNFVEPNRYEDSGVSLFVWNQMRVMAMEILEYRRSNGDLGCEWLEC